MSQAICTIITHNYGHYALALHDALIKYKEQGFTYCVLVSNGELPSNIVSEFKKREKVLIFSEADVSDLCLAVKLKEKYANTYHDAYRWSLKPILLLKLLKLNFGKVFYVDSDVYFYNKYQFLFQELES